VSAFKKKQKKRKGKCVQG